MSNFLENINASSPGLSKEELELLEKGFTPVRFDRDDHFLREGQICKHAGFIETGLLMYYTISPDGEELVGDFVSENEWVSHYESFIGETPSDVFIKAIEPSVIHTITLAKINELYKKIPVFEKIARQLVEKAFTDMMKRSLAFKNLKAEDRYRKLELEYPHIVQRVPQYYIASFLGIAPQSLSRIRKNRKH
jgi:CRP-like cAMP-binding protein